MERVQTTNPADDAQSPVGEKVHEASDVVATKAGEAMDKGRGIVSDKVGERSAQLGDQVGSASQTIRRVAEQARTEGNTDQARWADQAAERGERLSTYLHDVDPDRLLSDAEDFARRQPWLVAGAGLFLGFALARSLKASSGRRYARSAPHPSRYQGNGEASWSASPGAPRDVIAGNAMRTAEVGDQYA